MLSRRRFLERASAAAVTTTALPQISAVAQAAAPKTVKTSGEDPLLWVDPRIGTGGHGHTYPGATVPFGMVQLSPDTYNDGWDWCSGYHVSDTSIMGFSHTHLSGTGGSDLLDFLVMPGVGEVKLDAGPRENPSAGYRSSFDHAHETMEPGYYAVLLKDSKIRAELTATERTGVHRYTFPQSDQAWIIVDLHHANSSGKKSRTQAAELAMLNSSCIAGGHETSAWAQNRRIYFNLETSKRPDKIVFYSGDKETSVPAAGQKLYGQNLKAVLHFKTKADEAILVRVGISGASAEGGAKNLKAECPTWDFDKVRTHAHAAWRTQLSKIRVQSSNEAHKKVFYTALYHLSLGPTLYDDVDGQYRGMDNQVHTLPAGQHNYTSFSLWDTYRAAHPAYTLIDADKVPLFVNCLMRMAEESPEGMPVWPLGGRETGTMTGYHSASVMAEACNKGFTGVDWNKAYALMMKRAMVDNYRGLGFYRAKGYIPADKEEESVSKTFEYCYNDFAIAHVAKKLGKHDDAAMLTKRSTNYKNYFDHTTAFMRPKLDNGKFTAPFDPIDMGHSDEYRDYTESNAWQTTFGIQHDPAGLIALFGGPKPFITKLDALFTVPSTLPKNAPPDIAGLVGQYAHGNEPSHHIAYLYVYAGVPAKTQARARMLLETMYSPNPDGMQGNEDVGQMSAWYLLSALGFYPCNAVSGDYILGSPLFEHATLQLAGGKTLEIKVNRKDPAHQYIQAFTLNGKPQQRVWFNHSEIAHGGTLVLDMGPQPHPTLGTDPASFPPSLTV